MSFTFTLEHEDGSPAEPPTFSTAVPNWSPGDVIPFGRPRFAARRRGARTHDPDSDPVLVVVAG